MLFLTHFLLVLIGSRFAHSALSSDKWESHPMLVHKLNLPSVTKCPLLKQSYLHAWKFWPKILCHDNTVIICWLNKADIDDFIFNIFCDKLVAYIYMFGATSGCDIVGHENSTYIVNMHNGRKLDLIFILCNIWKTNITSFTASDAATNSASELDNAMLCWALDLQFIETSCT